MFRSDDGQLRGVEALHAERGHALLCYMQTQDEEKRDMTDYYCRPKVPFTLKFDSSRQELTIAYKYAHAHAYI